MVVIVYQVSVSLMKPPHDHMATRLFEMRPKTGSLSIFNDLFDFPYGFLEVFNYFYIYLSGF